MYTHVHVYVQNAVTCYICECVFQQSSITACDTDCTYMYMCKSVVTRYTNESFSSRQPKVCVFMWYSSAFTARYNSKVVLSNACKLLVHVLYYTDVIVPSLYSACIALKYATIKKQRPQGVNMLGFMHSLHMFGSSHMPPVNIHPHSHTAQWKVHHTYSYVHMYMYMYIGGVVYRM